MPRQWLARLLLLALLLLLSACTGPGKAVLEDGSLCQSFTLDRSGAGYGLRTGGRADMDNSLVHRHTGKEIAHQNNISLTIANKGETTLINPRVTINGRGFWQDLDAIIEQALDGAATDQDRIHLILEHLAENTHHDNPLFRFDNRNPVAMYNTYGGGFCGDLGHVAAALYRGAGLSRERLGRNPRLRLLDGHVMSEPPGPQGGYQFIDADHISFYLDRENRAPVDGDTLARDHDLIKRELHRSMNPVTSRNWAYSEKIAALFGRDDRLVPLRGRGSATDSPDRMDFSLRPGERIVFRWDNIGKTPSDWPSYKAGFKTMHYFGNSRIVYGPDLADPAFLGFTDSPEGLRAGPKGLEIVAPKATLVLWTETPFVVVGASLKTHIQTPDSQAEIAVGISKDGMMWKKTWCGKGGLKGTRELDLSGYLGLKTSRPVHRYGVLISISGGQGGLISGLGLTTHILASPMALPRLRAGANQILYEDDNKGPRRVEVTHRWREFPGIEPPPAIQAPLSPAPGGRVARTFVPFAWPKVQGAGLYQFRVSRRPDMLYPYRPSLDVYVEAPEYMVPKQGIFSHGVTYYWRVRARREGVWGPWSQVWPFTWSGPMVPRKVFLKDTDQGMVLTWEPNPKGTRPARYHVFGSDEKGFSVSREAYSVLGRGRVPGNYLGTTKETEFVVIPNKGGLTGRARAWYRVLAEDAAEVESCPSDMAALPTPHLITKTLGKAVAGQDYSFPLETVRSLGDLQFRKGRRGFFDEEELTYYLVRGPGWLSLDRKEGFLTGLPGRTDQGRQEVIVEVSHQFGEYTRKRYLLEVGP